MYCLCSGLMAGFMMCHLIACLADRVVLGALLARSLAHSLLACCLSACLGTCMSATLCTDGFLLPPPPSSSPSPPLFLLSFVFLLCSFSPPSLPSFSPFLLSLLPLVWVCPPSLSLFLSPFASWVGCWGTCILCSDGLILLHPLDILSS